MHELRSHGLNRQHPLRDRRPGIHAGSTRGNHPRPRKASQSTAQRRDHQQPQRRSNRAQARAVTRAVRSVNTARGRMETARERRAVVPPSSRYANGIWLNSQGCKPLAPVRPVHNLSPLYPGERGRG